MFIYYTRYYNAMLNVKLWRPRYQWFLHHHSPRCQTVPWVRCGCPKTSQILFMKRGECCKDALNVFQVQAAFRTRTGSCGYHFIFVHRIQQSTKRQRGSLWMQYVFAVYISGDIRGGSIQFTYIHLTYNPRQQDVGWRLPTFTCLRSSVATISWQTLFFLEAFQKPEAIQTSRFITPNLPLNPPLPPWAGSGSLLEHCWFLPTSAPQNRPGSCSTQV